MYNTEGTIHPAQLAISFEQLSADVATARIPPPDVQAALIQLATLSKAQRLFEARILNLFPSIAAINALERHAASAALSTKHG